MPPGDLSNEQEVLAWLLQQKTSDTIEEVTDEILEDLIANFEYVAVYFSECIPFVVFYFFII